MSKKLLTSAQDWDLIQRSKRYEIKEKPQTPDRCISCGEDMNKMKGQSEDRVCPVCLRDMKKQEERWEYMQDAIKEGRDEDVSTEDE